MCIFKKFINLESRCASRTRTLDCVPELCIFSQTGFFSLSSMLKSWRIFSACLLLLLIVGSCSSLISQIKNLQIPRTWPFLTTLYPSPSGTHVVLSYVWLFVASWTVAHQVPLSMEFSRQEYWSGLPFPTPRDLPNPGIELMSLASPALAAQSSLLTPPGKPLWKSNSITKLKRSSTSLIFPLTFYYNWNLFLLSTSFFPGVFTSGGFSSSPMPSIRSWRYSVCSCSSLMFSNHFSILPELHIIRV